MESFVVRAPGYQYRIQKMLFQFPFQENHDKKPQGLLQPIEIPLFPVQPYNIDIIGPLPTSKNGNHCVLIVVDQFSKSVFLEAISKHVTVVHTCKYNIPGISWQWDPIGTGGNY